MPAVNIIVGVLIAAGVVGLFCVLIYLLFGRKRSKDKYTPKEVNRKTEHSPIIMPNLDQIKEDDDKFAEAFLAEARNKFKSKTVAITVGDLDASGTTKPRPTADLQAMAYWNKMEVAESRVVTLKCAQSELSPNVSSVTRPKIDARYADYFNKGMKKRCTKEFYHKLKIPEDRIDRSKRRERDRRHGGGGGGGGFSVDFDRYSGGGGYGSD